MSEQLKNFEKATKIGEGAYGKVFSARHSVTGHMFALKKIYLQNDQEGIPSTTIREISLLKQIDHVNVLKLYDVINHNKRMYLVLDYCEKDLSKFSMDIDGELNLIMLKRIIYQILKGVEEIHKKKILHRDIKPQNILVKNSRIVKLADFG